ncbi:unnamed protein product [Penicillium salamii]|uniref:Protein required for cell viability n=1 Tax=Penicillium salamii TaxID=1612424 RepID=A0A9W4ILA0_9EURO|nr:unnamed protein product [Penicillium salamii]CAG8134135.1 unnamed protein product [Penicillium salamii]CAG8258618.1 unnamed protein product [Penicillium salamii]CAG8312627.1 unnamed protein product [Penicillium salamii]CAG8320111.1 unnamed protein product [Penicillium salamii]
MMEEDPQIQDAFSTANDFLTPVLDRDEIKKTPGTSLIQILSQVSDHDGGDDESGRPTVINKALDILINIHRSFVPPAPRKGAQQQYSDVAGSPMEDAKRRRMLHALLDLISLEGIYPSLSAGVGIPLQQRVISVLPAGIIAKKAHTITSSVPQNEPLLRRIIGVLLVILSDPHPSIQPIIRSRILSDVISGISDLAFNPNLEQSPDRIGLKASLTDIVEATPTTVLLPTLSSFLQSDTAQWFKSTISSQISHVPLRPGGVVQVIMFIASQFSPSLGQEAQDQSNGPRLTVQAIMQISRLLSSVPHGVDSKVYFETIAPQLLALIDGADPDLRKTASYVVANGILGKRAYGAVGTIGHSIFVEPIFNALTAELDPKSRQWMTQFTDVEGSLPQSRDDGHTSTTIVDSTTIDLALERLRCLTLQHPNPSVVKRLIQPILLPLWGLVCFSKEQQPLGSFHERVLPLLQTFFGISVGFPPLKKLVDNLLWDGGVNWTYLEDADLRVALVQRNAPAGDHSNLIRLMDSLHTRAELFISLLGSDPSSEERTGDIFLYVSEKWLVKPTISQPSRNMLHGGPVNETENITQKLVSAKVAEKLLDNFKEALTRRPLRVLELIKHIVDGELHVLQARDSAKKGDVSLSSLSNIVEKEDDTMEESAIDSSESLSTAFSLLSTLLASAEFSPTEELIPLLSSLKQNLDQLVPLLPPTLSKPGLTSSLLLEIQLATPDKPATQTKPAHIKDLETYRQAMANLTSDMPPVKAEGLFLLEELIMAASPVVDVSVALGWMLLVVTDTSGTAEDETYNHKAATSVIGKLASRHPHTVIKTLVEDYADKQEKRTLNQRLMIGQAMVQSIQNIGNGLSGETAKVLGETLIAVAGRRGTKDQPKKLRTTTQENDNVASHQPSQASDEENGTELSDGWSIPSEIAKVASELNLHDEDSDEETEEQKAFAANVVAAWAAGTSADDKPDDLRARASAISILGTAITTNIIGLGPTAVSSAIDLALSVLTLETATETAIMRRASVILILDTLKALETARETLGQDVGFGFSLSDNDSFAVPQAFSHEKSTVGNIPAMLRTLCFVESREKDGLTRQHLRDLVESLEAWTEKSLMWGIGVHEGQEALDAGLGLGGRIAGLHVDPMAGLEGTGRPRIEEIE